jgi:hypothetical protein
MNGHDTRSDEMANVRTASSWRGLWRRGLYASAGAAAANAGLYIAAVALGIFPSLHLLGSATPQPALVTILIVSCVATLVSTALFRLFAKRTRHPFFLLATLATVVLVFSFLPVTARADWSRAQVAMVELMHITVATAIVSALWGWQRMQQRNQY